MNTEQEIHQLVKALEPFARMDRGGNQDLQELACQRGTASDLTILTSADFRRAAEALQKVQG